MRPAFLISLMLLLLTVPVAAKAAPQVQARVDRTTLTAGESLQLYVTITNGGEVSVDTGPIAHFKIFPRGTSSSIRIVNMQRTRHETFSYMLVPLKTGGLTIPALTVNVDGQPFKTEPIDVTVTEASKQDLAAGDRDIWIEAEISAEKPYAGQQIAYTFRLYNAVQVRDARFSPPSFDGFSAEELEERNSYHKLINGRRYAVIEITFILVPRETGRLAIGPGMLEVGIPRRRQRDRFSPFDDFFGHTALETRMLQSNSLQVQVQPLPPYQGPGPFSGLVGTFDLTAAVENSTLEVGGSTTLTVTLEGWGNIQDAPPPVVSVPDGFKTYTDNPEETVNLDHAGYHGSKIFRTALVPMTAGTFALPPVTATYFDVEQKTYKTLASKPITLQVTGQAQAAPITIGPRNLSPIKKKVAFTGRDILPPKQSLEAVHSAVPLAWHLFVLWLLAPVPPVMALFLVQRMRSKDPGPGAVMKAKALKALKAARQASGDRNRVLTHLYQALSAVIFAAAGRYGEAMTWKEAETLLLQRGHDAETARQAAELLSRIESLKFSGAALDGLQEKELVERTRHMVRKLSP